MKSLKFELLFGDFQAKKIKADMGDEIIHAVDYFFLPGQIFGFACESQGKDFQKFSHVFILRACLPGDLGSIIPGISPGAEILVKTLIHASSLRLRTLLETLKKSNIELPHIPDLNYRKLNYLLETKMSTDYFVGELIGPKN
ncbi:MAG: hypothetical protein BWZ03_00292 [bacterium ADurb.BinA186]|nr:MAG: hypothetical protein BWZ03_00292 [bacterium ADurb.BinA186]